MRIVFVLASVFVGLVYAAPKSEKCSIEYLDECGKDLVLFSQKSYLPADQESLQQQCDDEKKSESCAREFVNNCMESLTRGIGIIVLDEIKKEIYTRCDTKHTNQKRYFEHVECLNKVGEQLHGCVNTMVGSMNAIAQASPRHQIGMACCHFGIFRTCADNAVQTVCDGNTRKYLNDVLEAYAGELLGLVCTSHKPGSPACNNLPPLPDVPLDTSGSLLSPLIKVAESLG